MPKPKKLYGLRAAWADLSKMRKVIISLGGVAAAVIAISGAWGITANIVEERRFWAKRFVEVQLVGLRIEADQRSLKDLDDKIFKIQFEMQRLPGSQFLREELKRTQEQRGKLQKKIDTQIQKGEK